MILNATWNGVVAVQGHALAELVAASGMSHEESLAWTRAHVHTVRQADVHPGYAGQPEPADDYCPGCKGPHRPLVMRIVP